MFLRQIQVLKRRTVRTHYFWQKIRISAIFSLRLAPQCSPTLLIHTPFYLHKISFSSQATTVMHHLKFFSGMKYLCCDLQPPAIICQGNLAGLNSFTNRQYKIFRIWKKCPWSTSTRILHMQELCTAGPRTCL